MKRILTASKWKQLREDIRAEERPEPAQPKMPVPDRLVAVTAQGIRLVSH